MADEIFKIPDIIKKRLREMLFQKYNNYIPFIYAVINGLE